MARKETRSGCGYSAEVEKKMTNSSECPMCHSDLGVGENYLWCKNDDCQYRELKKSDNHTQIKKIMEEEGGVDM